MFFFFVQSQIRQQVEVEKKEEVAMEMSDLVVYCQPRSKEKDRFGKDTRVLMNASDGASTGFSNQGFSLISPVMRRLKIYSFIHS